jgi:hypothetical protein
VRSDHRRWQDPRFAGEVRSKMLEERSIIKYFKKLPSVLTDGCGIISILLALAAFRFYVGVFMGLKPGEFLLPHTVG